MVTSRLRKETGHVAAARKRSHQWCLTLTPNNTETIERMIFHCFLRPIRRDLTSSSYTTEGNSLLKETGASWSSQRHPGQLPGTGKTAGKTWPIADRRVPSNNPRTNCETYFCSSSLPFSFLNIAFKYFFRLTAVKFLPELEWSGRWSWECGSILFLFAIF